ncbi:hypothetical protein [Novosphingobium malaysiense]|uniref:VOC domain-containing protein n=1 Tax=Novosphingobium malaysiense TaxID=1348853 RepID=A0A0B1ZLU8_9SPHN|nr:hypothetical protein [Novosphingobium malaysiense]KHK90260.1 hypothetical protein LK12_16610 [Novosphingobium malaysiense]
MRRIVNHVDHVAWIAHYDSIESHVAQIEELAGVKLDRFEREDAGILICVNWEAGLEILAPMPARTEFNGFLHEHLEQKGEGLFSIVFGVDSMAEHKQRLEALGHRVGPELDDHPASPWHHKLVMRERMVGPFMGGHFVLGEIDYADGVISIDDF